MSSISLEIDEGVNSPSDKIVKVTIRPIETQEDANAVFEVDKKVYKGLTEEQRRFIGGPKKHSFFKNSLDDPNIVVFGAFDEDNNSAYAVSTVNFNVDEALIASEAIPGHFKESSALLEGTRVLEKARGNSLQKKFTNLRLDVVENRCCEYALTQVVRDNFYSMKNMMEAGFPIVRGVQLEKHGLVLTFARPMKESFNLNGKVEKVQEKELSPELINDLTSRGYIGCKTETIADDQGDGKDTYFIFQSVSSSDDSGNFRPALQMA